MGGRPSQKESFTNTTPFLGRLLRYFGWSSIFVGAYSSAGYCPF